MKLIINKISISTDNEGRYSLNDLHVASGGKDKHKPLKFYRSHNFKEECEFLRSTSGQLEPIVKKTGRYGGTWVCKELVYSYAMWISPEFKMKVIQTFDALVNEMNCPKTMEALNKLTKKIEGDKELASKCGKLLSDYKNIKRNNEEKWLKGVERVQMKLGFEL